jgi:hypothetical protein
MTFLRIVIPLYLYDLSMIFSENRSHFSGSCSGDLRKTVAPGNQALTDYHIGVAV